MSRLFGWLCFTKSELSTLEQQLDQQQFSNRYELVNGVIMHTESGDRFQVSLDNLKKRVGVGHFIELRIDSPRL